jgi:hypothetical protein
MPAWDYTTTEFPHAKFYNITFRSSFDYVEQAGMRVHPLKLLAGYNAVIDFDCRDRALDVLVPLLELDSPRMAIRLGQKLVKDGTGSRPTMRAEIYDSLIPILTTNVGRSDSPILAAQCLRELSKAVDENKNGFQYIKGRLVELASRDARVSQLIWTDLYPIEVEEEVNDGDDATGATGSNLM